MPVLYLVATPIGNLEDITVRAVRVLQEVGAIAAEDTRTTRHLLSAYGIATPLTSYNDHNRASRIPLLLRRLEEEDVALVSEAGMPTISDPGYELVKAAVEHGVKVVPIPGASAVTAAVAASGFRTRQFLYLGFLPRRRGERRRRLQSLQGEPHTLVLFESPHRLRAALQDIADVLADRPLALCRELTKVHEEIFRGTAEQALEYFIQPRGEFTLVIQGAERQAAEMDPLLEGLGQARHAGAHAKRAVGAVAQGPGARRSQVRRSWRDQVALEGNYQAPGNRER